MREIQWIRVVILTSAIAAWIAAGAATAAVTYTASPSVDSANPLSALVPGDILTIDVTLRSDGEAVFAIGASAFGYDPDILRLREGFAAQNVLTAACIPTLGCLGGVDNVSGPSLSESFANPLGPRVQFLGAVSGSGVSNTGATDWGFDGVTGNPQFRVVFDVIGLGSTHVELGANIDYGDAVIIAGGAVGVSNNAVVNLTVVPEPGTALLLGLGLAVLSNGRERFTTAESVPPA